MAASEMKVDKLSAGNYQVWKIVITSQIKGKNLWDHVESMKREDAAAMINDEQTKALIYSAMEPQQIAATGVCLSAFDLWTKIKENHEGSESNLRSSALAEFLGLKHRKNESVVNYAGRYENILGKLTSAGHTVDEKTKLWVFSNSLPQHLKQTVQMWTMANPAGEVKDLISQLKIQHHLDSQEGDRRDVAYYAKDKEQQLDAAANPNRNIICSYCKKSGHKWRECRKLKSDNERKKKFGQNNRDNGPKDKVQDGHQKQNKGDPAKQSLKYSGAFNTKSHNFSEGKFTWIVDSGSTSHITPYLDLLADYVEFDEPHQLWVGDGKSLQAYGSGKFSFISNRMFKGELLNVLWVPDITENLFSICQALEQNCKVEFCNDKSEVSFYRENELVLRGRKKESSLYFLLELDPTDGRAQQTDGRVQQTDCAFLGATVEEWHKRLGHCSMDTVKALIQSNAVTGLTIANKEQRECRPCIMGKLCRSHHPQREQIKASRTAALLHIDTVGPMKHTSIGGARYFLLATEEYSNYMLFETVGTKQSIPDAVKRLINETELESARPVKAISTDCGSEFINHNLRKWTEQRGIVHYFSATYTPEQNGRAERSNRTILNSMRTLLNDSGLADDLWAEALNTAVYTTNRIPSARDKSMTRYELLKGEKPNIANLRVFGQKAIIKENDNRASKLAPRGEEVTFVGYTNRWNTYRFYVEHPTKQIICSCDAKFLSKSTNEDELKEPEKYVVVLNHDRRVDETDSDTTEINYVTSEEQLDDSSDEDTIIAQSSQESHSSMDTPKGPQSSVSQQPPRSRSQHLTPTIPRETRQQARAKSVGRSREGSVDNNGPAVVGVHDAAFFTLDDEPRTVKDAQESDSWSNWRKAMDEEMAALKKNGTWTLVDRRPNVKPIKNKWVFKAKLDSTGNVERYKARLVAKGFSQIPNIDYKETYAPVASMNTIRMLLAIANQNSMSIVQFDIKTAFLYGDLEEELYMEQPEGYLTDSNKICKLNKSLYGLKQAPRQWNRKFDSFLKLFSLKQSTVDKCLYYNEDKSLLLAIYVDDGLAAGRRKQQLDKLVAYLQENFELKVMDCKTYLGLEIIRDHQSKTLSIYQPNYIDKILKRFGMDDCKPASTPEEVGVKFTESPALPTDNQYKELVGSLLYLTTCTRPDIAHAVSIASRTAQPTQAHWTALKRILRYLKGSKDQGIRFRWENPNELIGYSDADYANDAETRKSTTGYCIYLSGGPIAWRCQRQPIITLSTTEAEYVAGCELVKEILPIRQQLVELDQIDEKVPTQILIDNQSTVRIASSESGQNRTKHIDIREKWLTEQVANKKIVVNHISGDEQAADILTKPLYKSKFIANRSKLLTQIMTVMAIISLCSPSIRARILKPTDPTSTVKSDKVSIKGDIRYKSTIIFANPCENLFNYSTTVSGTEMLIKHCFDYFEKKHLRPLTNCKRQPTIGPNLNQIPLSYNCNDDPKSGLTTAEGYTGKCDITKRDPKISLVPQLELNQLQESWDKHKRLVDQLPTNQREKRFVPAIAVGLGIVALIAGPAVKTYKTTQANADSIETLVSVTELHSRIIKESTIFLDQYKNSVTALHSWAEDIEERLDKDPLAHHLYSDISSRGKKASLVKGYMQWFDTQERLLRDVNTAAAHRHISQSLGSMLNGTSNFGLAANLSTLYECSYRLENKNMILDLEFLLPQIDEDIEILKVLATDVYTHHSHPDEGGELYCWETYTGPSFMIHNKTNGCIKALNKNKIGLTAIRGQTCLDASNDLYYPNNRSEIWAQESCTKEIPMLNDRIQITEIDGAHKIYCYPFAIEIENEPQPCPNTTFILEGHAKYRIENITHHGAYVDTSMSRQIDTSNVRLVRRKRSPMPPPMMTSQPPVITVSRPIVVEAPITVRPVKFTDTLRNLTGQMNLTLIRIKESIGLLPEKLNITRANFDSLLELPFEIIGDSLNSISGYIKSLGSIVGLLTVAVLIIIIMPVLEVMIIGIRIIKIPANLWLASAKRVTSNIKHATSTRLPYLLTKKKRHWTDTVKTV